MHSTIALAALSGLALVNAQAPGTVGPGTTGKLGNALITTNNPAGVTYTATLPNRNTTTIRGYVSATSNANGTGVLFNVNLFGFTNVGTEGPFRESSHMSFLNARQTNQSAAVYHIHDQPVPADGKCAGTLAHLDPFIRGEIPPCDATHPETCQVGDLSGKHGNITSTPFQASYVISIWTSSGHLLTAYL